MIGEEGEEGGGWEGVAWVGPLHHHHHHHHHHHRLTNGFEEAGKHDIFLAANSDVSYHLFSVKMRTYAYVFDPWTRVRLLLVSVGLEHMF